MKLLILGGTRFVGKHAVLEAVRREHTVTLFNRGNNPLPTPEVRHLRGDRNEDLDALAGERFDAVIDTSAYLPKQVASAARTLSERVDNYLFISTISVYAEQTEAGLNEDSAVIELDDPEVEEVTGETYGGLKVLCERALERELAGNRLVVRPGIVVGPDDTTDRFTYWPVRLARGGEVLAPRGPELPMQWIDVRDLAVWMIDMLEKGMTGTFNAVSEPDRFNLGGLIEACGQVAGSRYETTWVSEEFLLEQEVRPFADIPLWIAGEQANFFRVDGSRAYANGLSIRPAEESARDTLEWYRSKGGWDLKVGFDRDREQQVLRKWHERG